MPAATETLRLATVPESGMPTMRSQSSRVRRRSPDPSAPSTQATGPVTSASNRLSPPASAPRIHTPFDLRSRSVRARLVTVMTGTVSAAPLAAFATVALTPTARSLGTMTACAPNASALRRHAPRLCGSVTPSSTSSSAGSDERLDHVVERHRRVRRGDDGHDALMAVRAGNFAQARLVGRVHRALRELGARDEVARARVARDPTRRRATARTPAAAAGARSPHEIRGASACRARDKGAS